MGGINNSLTVQKTEKFNIKVLANPVFVEAHLLIYQTVFSLHLHVVENREREQASMCFIRVQIPFMKAPLSRTNPKGPTS